MGVHGCAPHDITGIALPGQEGTLRQEVREAKEDLQLDGGEGEEGGARGHLGMSVSGCISHVARGPPRFLSVTALFFMLPRLAFAANQIPSSLPDHQAIKLSGHQITRSSNHQITGSSNCPSPNHQIIKSSGHQIYQIIKSSDHQTIRSSGHQIAKLSNHEIIGSWKGEENSCFRPKHAPCGQQEELEPLRRPERHSKGSGNPPQHVVRTGGRFDPLAPWSDPRVSCPGVQAGKYER